MVHPEGKEFLCTYFYFIENIFLKTRRNWNSKSNHLKESCRLPPPSMHLRQPLAPFLICRFIQEKTDLRLSKMKIPNSTQLNDLTEVQLRNISKATLDVTYVLS